MELDTNYFINCSCIYRLFLVSMAALLGNIQKVVCLYTGEFSIFTEETLAISGWPLLPGCQHQPQFFLVAMNQAVICFNVDPRDSGPVIFSDYLIGTVTEKSVNSSPSIYLYNTSLGCSFVAIIKETPNVVTCCGVEKMSMLVISACPVSLLHLIHAILLATLFIFTLWEKIKMPRGSRSASWLLYQAPSCSWIKTNSM